MSVVSGRTEVRVGKVGRSGQGGPREPHQDLGLLRKEGVIAVVSRWGTGTGLGVG